MDAIVETGGAVTIDRNTVAYGQLNAQVSGPLSNGASGASSLRDNANSARENWITVLNYDLTANREYDSDTGSLTGVITAPVLSLTK